MAASETEVGNAALIKLGERPVLNFDEDNDRARILKARFDAVRDAEIRAHRWNFAMARAKLSALTEAPAFGYELQYSLPSDCLQLVEVDGSDVIFGLSDLRGPGGAAFAIEGGRILTDLTAPLPVRYVRREETPTLWDATFEEALACRLAMELCEPLTQSAGMRQKTERAYAVAISTARRLNAIEKPPEAAGDDSWVAGRR